MGGEDLREGEVVTSPDGRPGSHRDAEACSAGLTALDGDPQRLASPLPIAEVAGLPEHLVGDVHRGHLAGADPEEGERGSFALLRLDRERIAGTNARPEALARREQVLLPAVGADVVAEERLVGPALETVLPGFLLVSPAGGEVRVLAYLAVHDRTVPDGGPDNAIPAGPERAQERRESAAFEYEAFTHCRTGARHSYNPGVRNPQSAHASPPLRTYRQSFPTEEGYERPERATVAHGVSEPPPRIRTPDDWVVQPRS